MRTIGLFLVGALIGAIVWVFVLCFARIFGFDTGIDLSVRSVESSKRVFRCKPVECWTSQTGGYGPIWICRGDGVEVAELGSYISKFCR